MEGNKSIASLINSVLTAGDLPKCRKCGCMKETLETINKELLNRKDSGSAELAKAVKSALGKSEPIRYT